MFVCVKVYNFLYKYVYLYLSYLAPIVCRVQAIFSLWLGQLVSYVLGYYVLVLLFDIIVTVL